MDNLLSASLIETEALSEFNLTCAYSGTRTDNRGWFKRPLVTNFDCDAPAIWLIYYRLIVCQQVHAHYIYVCDSHVEACMQGNEYACSEYGSSALFAKANPERL